MSTTPLIIMKPLAIIDAMLVSCNVPETDHAVYAAATSYTKGARCIVTAGDVHKIYESVYAGANVGNDPTLPASASYWKAVSATNRHKCFDTSSSTQTVQAGSASYRIKPGQVINGIFIANCRADSVRIRVIDPTDGTVYDKTTSLAGKLRRASFYDWFFSRSRPKTMLLALDLPPYYGADILIDFTAASGDVAVGVLALGYQQRMGKGVKYGLQGGITDYSTKKTNDYGDVVFNVLGYSDELSFVAVCDNGEIDDFKDQLIELRATPIVVIASDLYRCTVTFGWLGEWRLLIPYPTESEYSITMKGLT